MVAKMILPLLGGSPSVWNTCLFFFQFVLLVGYGYAHLTTFWKSRFQPILHLGLMLIPGVLLPIVVQSGWTPPLNANPVIWLLLLLIQTVGLPFLLVSTSAPLLQRWFTQTNHPASQNPYVLYAASNLGSLLGLISYPLLIEPTLSLTQQSKLWAGGYALLVLLTLVCAVQVWRSQPIPKTESLADFEKSPSSRVEEAETELPRLEETPTLIQQGRWVVLAFVPSSLLLGVTTYLTTDIASVPFLWAVPLALYLITFVLAFARQPQLPAPALLTLMPLVFTGLVGLFLLQITQPAWVIMPLHLAGFFVAANVFHGELARTKPDPAHLTLFYFWIAVGGVLGGWFNAIAAPLIFSTVLEYPLMLALSLLLLPQFIPDETMGSGFRRTLPFGVGLLLAMLLIGFNPQLFSSSWLSTAIALGLTGAIALLFSIQPVQLVVALILVFLLNQFALPSMGGILANERSFFGVYRVLNLAPREGQAGYRSLLHGTTLHGKQSLDLARRREPLTYFSRTGPIGQFFQAFNSDRFSHVAILGLGAGSLAAYAAPGQEWTFYEIDPTDVTLAQKYFTFLQDAPASTKVVLGDGRLALQQAGDRSYDLLVMDAFSSDSIPVHLVTKEAVQVYLSKLKEDGLLIINISNRYLNLEPVLGALAEELGLASLKQLDLNVPEAERKLGKSPSHWVILAKQPASFGSLLNEPSWQPLEKSASAPVWTDDFSDIFRIVRAFRGGRSLS